MNQPHLNRYQNTSAPHATIHVRKGNLYFKASLYQKYFPDLQSAILMKKDKTLFILPVVNANAGGLLLKIRNAQGNRVIHAQDFFRENGIDEELDQMVPVFWDRDSSGLVVQMPSSAYLRVAK